MSSYSWIKLYHEVLHDPKMGRLTDDLWRRAIEIFLMAGEYGDGGLLPDVNDMAWTLRLSVEKLESDLSILEKCNIVEKDKSGRWKASNFAKRQAPIESSERVAAFRDRQKKQKYYGDETPIQDDSNVSETNRYTDTEKIQSKNEIREDKEVSAKKLHTPPASIPLGVVAYREAAHRFPNKSLYALIDQHVGSDPPRVDFWKQVIIAWISLGWNPSNITGQLECFDRNEIPHKNGASKGTDHESNAFAALRLARERREAKVDNGDA